MGQMTEISWWKKKPSCTVYCNANIGSVYFAVSGKSTAVAIVTLPLAKHDWLNWSYDKCDMFGFI